MPWKPIPYPDRYEKSELCALMKKARFFIDEDVDDIVAEYLKEKGWNIKTVRQVGLTHRDDKDILAFALRENRVLITHDNDFLDDRRYPPQQNPGVVVLPDSGRDFPAFATSLHNMLMLVGHFKHFQSGKKVIFSSDGNVVIRGQEGGKKTESRYRFTRNGPALKWVNE